MRSKDRNCRPIGVHLSSMQDGAATQLAEDDRLKFPQSHARKPSPSDIMVPHHLLGTAYVNDNESSTSWVPINVLPHEAYSSWSDEETLPLSIQQNWGAIGAMDLGCGEPEGVECSICMTKMLRPTVGGSCAHHACEECYVKRCEIKPSCPVCRAPVWRISVDFECARQLGLPSCRAPVLGEPSSLPSSAMATSNDKSSSDEAADALRVSVEGLIGAEARRARGACFMPRSGYGRRTGGGPFRSMRAGSFERFLTRIRERSEVM